jgi:hypothetical protein
LYYKPRYSVSGSECTSGPPLGTSTFIWCIDGVFETQPININPAVNLVPFAINESSITYHPGNWDFNFIGLASFNAKPIQSLWENYASKLNPEVLRYALDFDPIITANYYQAYAQFNKTELRHMFD